MKKAEWKNVLERATKRREASMLESEAAVAAYREANAAEHALFLEFFADRDLSVADREELAPAGISERERGKVPFWMNPREGGFFRSGNPHGIQHLAITRENDLLVIWVNGERFISFPMESFIKAETKPKGAMSEPIVQVKETPYCNMEAPTPFLATVDPDVGLSPLQAQREINRRFRERINDAIRRREEHWAKIRAEVPLGSAFKVNDDGTITIAPEEP